MRKLRGWLGWVWRVALCGVLAACGTTPPPPTDLQSLLNDALFGHPQRPAEADSVMALSDDMRRYLQAKLPQQGSAAIRPRALFEALYAQGQLRLDYDASTTRNAAQAFEARAGNCLSLVVMTAALARELGMNVTYQSARVDEAYSRNGGLTLRSGHVNIVLGERPTRTPGRTSAVALGGDGDRLQIDFLPAPELQGLHTQPITEQRVLAMFMNNRAAEALQQGQTAQAYAWARVALQRDAGFTSALNTLAVVYQRAGHLPQAQAVLQQVLAQDDHHLAALWNLVQVLQAQGLHGQAQHWQARLAHLEPVPPFAQLQQGQAAMARGEPAKARDLLLAEQRLTGDSHELYFWLARAHHALGDQAAAQRAMAHAQALAPAGEQQSRYAAKLAWLRAQAVH